MYNNLKNDAEYLENIDLVQQWDFFQDAACCLKDLYTGTLNGSRNVSNFVGTIKAVDCYYKNTVDILIKKRQRYNDFGTERSRLRLLHFVKKGKSQHCDKVKLINQIYGKHLRHELRRDYPHFRFPYDMQNVSESIHQTIDVYRTDTELMCYKQNYLKKPILKRQYDIFNDAVDLKSLQGNLSEFELSDPERRSFIISDNSSFCQSTRDKRRRPSKDL